MVDLMIEGKKNTCKRLFPSKGRAGGWIKGEKLSVSLEKRNDEVHDNVPHLAALVSGLDNWFNPF